VVPVLLFLTLVVFILDKLSGVNPARAELGANARPAALASLEHKLWLDRPLLLQYLHYLDRLVMHADLGISIRTQRSVQIDLRSALPPTIELALFAGSVVILLALILGISSALASRGSSVFRVIMIAASSAPVFLTAIGAIYIFYGKLHVLPSGGQTSYPDAPTGPTGFLLIDSLLTGQAAVFGDALQHLILPGLTLALVPAVAVGRVLRSSLVAVRDSDHVRTARSKGLSERSIVLRHALRNALTAPLAMTGIQLGFMFAGIVVIEYVFAWPGIGQYAAEAIPVDDFPAVAGVTLVVGLMYILLNLAVDILQAIADPRIEL
jgi:peptide/nickel transport system permease protein